MVKLSYSYPENETDPLYKRPSIYESTRKYWVVSAQKAREMDYVLGVYEGIVRSVYKPFSWKEYSKPDPENGDTPFKTIRHGFEGAFVLDSPYLTTDVSDYPFGRSPFQYISGRGGDNVNWDRRASAAFVKDWELDLAEAKPMEDVNARDGAGWSKLMYAARDRGAGALKDLLDAGADVNARNNKGVSALMLAAWNNTSADVVRLLLIAGSDVNAKNNNGTSTLMFAALGNTNPYVVKALVDAGADLNARDASGKRAVDYLEARARGDDTFAKSETYRKMQQLLQ